MKLNNQERGYQYPQTIQGRYLIPSKWAKNRRDLVKPPKPKPNEKPTESDSPTPTYDDSQNADREKNFQGQNPVDLSQKKQNKSPTEEFIIDKIIDHRIDRDREHQYVDNGKAFIAYFGTASKLRSIDGNPLDTCKKKCIVLLQTDDACDTGKYRRSRRRLKRKNIYIQKMLPSRLAPSSTASKSPRYGTKTARRHGLTQH